MAGFSSKKEYGEDTVASRNQEAKDSMWGIATKFAEGFKKKPAPKAKPEAEGSDAAKLFVKGFNRK